MRKVRAFVPPAVLLIWPTFLSCCNEASAEGWPHLHGVLKRRMRLRPYCDFCDALYNTRGGSGGYMDDMNQPEHVLQHDGNNFLVEHPSPDEQEEYFVILSKLLKEKQKKAVDVIISVRSPFYRFENKSTCTYEVVRSDDGNNALDVDLLSSLLSYRGGGWQHRMTKSSNQRGEKLGKVIDDSFDKFCRFISLWVVWIASIQAFGKAISHDRVVDELATKLLSEDTAKAVKNINNILNKFSDHGVVDLFQLYSTKDIVMSVLALSRLQRAANESSLRFASNEKDENGHSVIADMALLSDLAHYAAFANAAYGWKGGLALSGRLHLGMSVILH